MTETPRFHNRVLIGGSPSAGGAVGQFLGRIVLAIIGAGILVLAFFFITAALIAGAFLAAGLAARWWWALRRLRRQADSGVVEGEYAVIEREPLPAPPPRAS
jgi:hypothetical protein